MQFFFTNSWLLVNRRCALWPSSQWRWPNCLEVTTPRFDGHNWRSPKEAFPSEIFLFNIFENDFLCALSIQCNMDRRPQIWNAGYFANPVKLSESDASLYRTQVFCFTRFLHRHISLVKTEKWWWKKLSAEIRITRCTATEQTHLVQIQNSWEK